MTPSRHEEEQRRSRRRRGSARLGLVLAVVVPLAVMAAVAAVVLGVHLGGTDGGQGTRAWRIVSAPGDGALLAISCVSSGDCWAVGGSTVEHSSGAGWTVVSNPTPSGGAISGGGLVSVVCAAAHDCWAVGTVNILGGSAGAPLIEHYSGVAWTIAGGPPMAPEVERDAIWLSAVTCVTSDDCWAVGSNGQEGGPPTQPLVAHYDGDAWSVVPGPSIPGTGGSLDAVACATATDCWAVGQEGSGALIEQFAGSGWSVVGSPPTGLLSAVTCVDADECWAVGYTGGGDTSQPLVEEYAGSGWAVVPSPHVNAANGGEFSGVACSSPDDCWAVGDIEGPLSDLMGTPPPDMDAPLTDHYSSGRWALVSDGDVSDDAPIAISCMPSGGCWAVGGLGTDPSGGPLTETTT